MQPPSPIGSPGQPLWLKGVIGAILLFNVLDGMFTLLWVESGLARESNPLLVHLVENDPWLFVGVKFIVVTLGIWLLWRLRHHRLAIFSLFLAFLAYYWVLIYHLSRLVPLLLG